MSESAEHIPTLIQTVFLDGQPGYPDTKGIGNCASGRAKPDIPAMGGKRMARQARKPSGEHMMRSEM